RLHYVEEGDGPLVVLLHGFPEFWYSWRLQIPALAAAGFRVVAPDLRGYNLSSRPAGVAPYSVDLLARDVGDLIAERGETSAMVAGHDWGGVVAWALAATHPDAVQRLAILNAPHPQSYVRGLRRPSQLLKSAYVFFFQLPRVPERALAREHFVALRSAFEQDARPGAFGAEDIERYVETWARPGALTAMLNYYRASTRRSPNSSVARKAISAPTLIIWGGQDRYLEAGLAGPPEGSVPGLREVVHLPRASHWVQHDEPEEVNRLLVDFFTEEAG
ncbi:MAG: alpha/beta hydrolase, partial [Chloroflexota bacterium]|nr:alpha/beta hydrolase [Chloroflexota bacterium]